MAQSEVIIRIPCSDFQLVGEVEGLTVTEDATGKKLDCTILDGTKTGRASYALSLPDAGQITRLNFPYLLSNVTDGETVNVTVSVGDNLYSIDSNGDTSSDLITLLNTHRAENNAYPALQLNVELTAVNGSTTCFITYPQVTYSLAGGNAVVQPTADVSVEHDIPEGFSGIYQLLDEPVPDNDATIIRSPSGKDGASGSGPSSEHLISTVKLGQLPRLRDIKQLVMGICIKFNGPSSTSLKLYSSAFTDSVTTSFYHSVSYEWLNLTQVADATSSFVQAYQDYCKNNITPPELYLEIDTCGSYSSSGSKYGTAGSCDVSQVYIEAAYEDVGTGIYQKQGGTWKEATAAYQKVNGSWVQITENAYKSALQERLVLVENQYERF